MNYLEPVNTNISIGFHTGVKGHWKLEAVKADGSRRHLAEFDNLVLNNGLDLLGMTTNFQTYCSVGTGNTAPATSQSSLVSFIASTSTTTTTSQSNSGSSPYYGQTTWTYRFAIGTATGNLSEIGVGSANDGTNLFSRALILDGGGSPTTITVLSSEALDATYQLQLYAPTADVTGNVTINAVSYAYVFRAANASSANWNGLHIFGERAGLFNFQVFNGSIGSVTSQPSGSVANNGGIAVQTYTTGNYYVDNIVSFGLTDGNVSGGVTSALMTMGISNASFGQFQMSFSPALPKDSSHTMTLTVRHSWGRYP